MRTLTAKEVEQVSGGWTIGGFVSDEVALGSLGSYMLRGALQGAMRGGIYGSLIGAAFGLGYFVSERLGGYPSLSLS